MRHTGKAQKGLFNLNEGAVRRSPRKHGFERSQRKLDFHDEITTSTVKKPLRLERFFFLDFQPHGKLSSIRKIIESLGGVVEDFLSKEVTCVLTTKDVCNVLDSSNPMLPPSPKSGPSPYQFLSSSKPSVYVNSPLSTDSPGSVEPFAFKKQTNTITRGKALLEKATSKKRRNGDLLAKANLWGARIWNVNEFLALYVDGNPRRTNSGNLATKKKKSHELFEAHRTKKVSDHFCAVPLLEPVLKVEDQSRYYRPFFNEFRQWPCLYLDSHYGSCPFDLPKKGALSARNEEEQHDKEETTVANESEKASPQQPGALNTPAEANAARKESQYEKKAGYCECCSLRYSDLDKHLKGADHRKFARDESNFSKLDKLIRYGSNLRSFLQEVARREHDLSALDPAIDSSVCNDSFGKLKMDLEDRCRATQSAATSLVDSRVDDHAVVLVASPRHMAPSSSPMLVDAGAIASHAHLHSDGADCVHSPRALRSQMQSTPNRRKTPVKTSRRETPVKKPASTSRRKTPVKGTGPKTPVKETPKWPLQGGSDCNIESGGKGAQRLSSTLPLHSSRVDNQLEDHVSLLEGQIRDASLAGGSYEPVLKFPLAVGEADIGSSRVASVSSQSMFPPVNDLTDSTAMLPCFKREQVNREFARTRPTRVDHARYRGRPVADKVSDVVDSIDNLSKLLSPRSSRRKNAKRKRVDKIDVPLTTPSSLSRRASDNQPFESPEFCQASTVQSCVRPVCENEGKNQLGADAFTNALLNVDAMLPNSAVDITWLLEGRRFKRTSSKNWQPGEFDAGMAADSPSLGIVKAETDQPVISAAKHKFAGRFVEKDSYVQQPSTSMMLNEGEIYAGHEQTGVIANDKQAYPGEGEAHNVDRLKREKRIDPRGELVGDGMLVGQAVATDSASAGFVGSSTPRKKQSTRRQKLSREMAVAENLTKNCSAASNFVRCPAKDTNASIDLQVAEKQAENFDVFGTLILGPASLEPSDFPDGARTHEVPITSGMSTAVVEAIDASETMLLRNTFDQIVSAASPSSSICSSVQRRRKRTKRSASFTSSPRDASQVVNAAVIKQIASEVKDEEFVDLLCDRVSTMPACVESWSIEENVRCSLQKDLRRGARRCLHPEPKFSKQTSNEAAVYLQVGSSDIVLCSAGRRDGTDKESFSSNGMDEGNSIDEASVPLDVLLTPGREEQVANSVVCSDVLRQGHKVGGRGVFENHELDFGMPASTNVRNVDQRSLESCCSQSDYGAIPRQVSTSEPVHSLSSSCSVLATEQNVSGFSNCSSAISSGNEVKFRSARDCPFARFRDPRITNTQAIVSSEPLSALSLINDSNHLLDAFSSPSIFSPLKSFPESSSCLSHSEGSGRPLPFLFTHDLCDVLSNTDTLRNLIAEAESERWEEEGKKDARLMDLINSSTPTRTGMVNARRSCAESALTDVFSEAPSRDLFATGNIGLCTQTSANVLNEGLSGKIDRSPSPLLETQLFGTQKPPELYPFKPAETAGDTSDQKPSKPERSKEPPANLVALLSDTSLQPASPSIIAASLDSSQACDGDRKFDAVKRYLRNEMPFLGNFDLIDRVKRRQRRCPPELPSSDLLPFVRSAPSTGRSFLAVDSQLSECSPPDLSFGSERKHEKFLQTSKIANPSTKCVKLPTRASPRNKVKESSLKENSLYADRLENSKSSKRKSDFEALCERSNEFGSRSANTSVEVTFGVGSCCSRESDQTKSRDRDDIGQTAREDARLCEKKDSRGFLSGFSQRRTSPRKKPQLREEAHGIALKPAPPVKRPRARSLHGRPAGGFLKLATGPFGEVGSAKEKAPLYARQPFEFHED